MGQGTLFKHLFNITRNSCLNIIIIFVNCLRTPYGVLPGTEKAMLKQCYVPTGIYVISMIRQRSLIITWGVDKLDMAIPYTVPSRFKYPAVFKCEKEILF